MALRKILLQIFIAELGPRTDYEARPNILRINHSKNQRRQPYQGLTARSLDDRVRSAKNITH